MDVHREATEKKQAELVLIISEEEEEEEERPSKKNPKMETFEASHNPPESITTEIELKSIPILGKPPKPPRSESVLRRRSIPSSAFAKPKSRFVEQTPVVVPSPCQDSFSSAFGSPSIRSLGSPKTIREDEEEEEEEEEEGEEEEDDDDDEIFKKEHSSNVPHRRRRRRFRVFRVIECLILVLDIACLILSLSVHRLHGHVIRGLEIWKWCLMVAVIFCGRLVSNWVINILVFLIERNFLLKRKALYFVNGLKQSLQVFLWSSLICLSWLIIFNRGVQRSEKTENALIFVERLIVSLVVGSVIWLAKTLFVKVLASSFHMNRFFDRIQESIFHQYILQSISGPPLMELGEKVGGVKHSGQLSFWNFRSKGKGKRKGKRIFGEKQEVIDVSKLYKLRREKVSAWTMKGLVNVIMNSGLSTLSNTIDESFVEDEHRDREIISEWDAKVAAYRIFKNVARPGCKYIDSSDLLRFLSREEVMYVMPLFEGAADSGKIKKSALRNWVVKAYLERKSLAHSLNDTKTAVNQLHKLAATGVLIVVLIFTLILTGIATTKVLVFISSQLLLVGFMFNNTCKMVFEAIIFVFVMHPFDVGDRCVVDGIEMTVEEMNILTTVFLRFDNEKIYYPNSVLATKPISNFYRSPDMGDALDFSIAVSTSVETIGALKARIKAYIDSKPNHWHPGHLVVVKEIVDVNSMNMVLYVNHTMNFQNPAEKNLRRTDLVLELKKIVEELSIRYEMLPQGMDLSYTETTPLPMALS